MHTAGVVAALLAAGMAVLVALALPPGYDFRAYWLAAQHLLDGGPLYPGPGVHLGLSGGFRYAPLIAVPFLVFTPLSFEIARWIWIALLIVVATVVARSGIRTLPWAARPWAAAGVVVFLPLVLEVVLGNLNLLTLALCLVAWRWRDRAPIGGPVLALAVGLKLLPAALLLFYVGTRRWRLLGWTAATGAIGLAITAAVMPDRLAEYLRFAPRLLEQDWVFEVIDRPRPEWLAAIFWNDAFPNVLAIVVAIGAFVAGRASRSGGERATTLHHITLATMGYLAPFGYFWTTFLILTLPLFGDVLRRSLALESTRSRVAAVSVVVLCWGLIQVQQLRDLVPILAHLTGATLLVTLALVLLGSSARAQIEGRSMSRSRAKATASS